MSNFQIFSLKTFLIIVNLGLFMSQAGACDIVPVDAYTFPDNSVDSFFPPATELKCVQWSNGERINLPVREKDGVLIYVLGKAPIARLNEYLKSRGSEEKAKPMANDPSYGTVRIAYYDMHVNNGKFNSLAVNIVTEGGDIPAAFHYAMYLANEKHNQDLGLYQNGINKIRAPIRSNLRQVLPTDSVGSGSDFVVHVQAGQMISANVSSLFALRVKIPGGLQYQRVPELPYRAISEGVPGRMGPQTVIGKLRGDFSTVIPRESVKFDLNYSGILKEKLKWLGFVHTGFQVIKNFDLVERQQE